MTVLIISKRKMYTHHVTSLFHAYGHDVTIMHLHSSRINAYDIVVQDIYQQENVPHLKFGRLRTAIISAYTSLRLPDDVLFFSIPVDVNFMVDKLLELQESPLL